MTLPTIQTYLTKASFDHEKAVVTETIEVNPDELWDRIMQQMKLARKLEDTKKYSLIAKEIRKGEDELSDIYTYVKDEQQIKLKIAVPITRFLDNEMKIEFISGKGEVLEVFHNHQWKNFNGTWEDLFNKLNRD